MSKLIEVKVPDIGDFKDIPVIEVLVKPGDSVKPEDPLISLESDKATMDVPAPQPGTVKDIKIKVGDKVSQGTLILTLDADGAARKRGGTAPRIGAGACARAGSRNPPLQHPPRLPAAAAPARRRTLRRRARRHPRRSGGARRGSRRLYRGIPRRRSRQENRADRALSDAGRRVPERRLHSVESAAARRQSDQRSRASSRTPASSFGKPKIDIDKLRAWKDSVVGKLTKGLAGLAKQRKVRVVQGNGEFASAQHDRASKPGRRRRRPSSFDHCIIAAGSSAVAHPGLSVRRPAHLRFDRRARAARDPEAPAGHRRRHHRARDGDGVFDARQQINVVELMDGLMPGADKDVVKRLAKRIEKRYEKILLKTKVVEDRAAEDGLKVTFEGEQAPAEPQVYDYMLMAVGRRPNGSEIKAEAPASPSTSAATSRSTSRCAPTCRISTRSATSSASRCSRTRRRTKASRGRSHRRAQGVFRRAHHSFGRLHRSRNRVDGPDRRRSARRRASSIGEGGIPVGRERPRARDRPRRRHDQAAVRQEHAPPPRRRHRRRTRAN